MSPKSRNKTVAAGAKPAATRSAKVRKAEPSAKVTAAKTAAKRVAKTAAKPISVSASGPAEGGKAPQFSIPQDNGKTVSLADFAGRNLVIFFYPRADTPGCTTEAKDFTRHKSAFDQAGTALLGVSADPPKKQARFRDKHQLTMPLGSDEEQTMLTAYGAWGEKSMYGRAFMGVIRSTVLIDAQGRTVKVWRNVKVDGHADEVLAAARAIGS